MAFLKFLACCLISPFLWNCASQHEFQLKQTTVKHISTLKFVDEFVLPFNFQFRATTVGGLSGIDYDPVNEVYYLICDDRSHINPARFYKAKIDISAKGIDTVIITDVKSLLQKDGSTYPEIAKNIKTTTDPEAMRLNRRSQHLIWTSEGERSFKPMDTILIDPTISVIDTAGKYIDTIPLPPGLRMHIEEKGPRRNGVLEGLTFADDFRSLYINMEEPRYEDGPQADLTQNTPYIRIYKFNLKNGNNTAQYAYKLDPVAFPSPIENGAINNGIPDILWLGKDKMMVTERAFSTGLTGANIKVFVVDIKKAKNIIGVESLKDNPPVHPLEKRLILNMDKLGIYIDNIEGATLGPVLSNGHQSVIFVSDNNFSKKEKTQLLLFEVIP